jgi:hypothetical protein
MFGRLPFPFDIDAPASRVAMARCGRAGSHPTAAARGPWASSRMHSSVTSARSAMWRACPWQLTPHYPPACTQRPISRVGALGVCVPPEVPHALSHVCRRYSSDPIPTIPTPLTPLVPDSVLALLKKTHATRALLRRRLVAVGGPGVGKSALLGALKAADVPFELMELSGQVCLATSHLSPLTLCGQCL